MPPPLILDPAQIDWNHVIADREAIARVLPHRYEFALLDGVVLLDIPGMIFAGFHEVRPEAFWARGHIPGRPLLPGVLMVEAGAQLASFVQATAFPGSPFMGFVGIDRVRFRGVVEPPCRLQLIGRGLQVKPRRFVAELQGFVHGSLVYDGEIMGMAL